MRCLEFRESIVDLARGQALGGVVEERAREHAGECEACAALLAAEARLTASLEILRGQDRNLQSPPRLEEVLLEDFRNWKRPKPLGAPRRGAHWGWYAAAAAVVVLAVWMGPWRQVFSTGNVSVALHVPDAMERAGESGPPPAAAAPAPTSTPTASTTVAAGASGKATGSLKAGRPGTEHEQPEAQPGRTRANTRASAEAEPRAQPGSGAREPAVAAGEIVTEFVPLTYAGWVNAAPEARLVRVRLPSAALLYFGIPAGGAASVEADVVLGQDGLAQAVRFVRPATASAAFPRKRESQEPQY